MAVTLTRSATKTPGSQSAPASSAFATLSVSSRPPGARVLIDGKAMGTTPLSLARVAVGNHSIQLEQDGYRRWTSSVRVTSGARNRVAASLER
jgi:hypothetical protein